jgi:hypothetical protein
MKAKIKELEIETTAEEIDEYMEYVKEENKLTQEELVEQLKREGCPLKNTGKR